MKIGCNNILTAVLLSSCLALSQSNNNNKSIQNYSYDSLLKYVGDYPCGNNFFNDSIIIKELKTILKGDYKDYREFLGACGCGEIEFKDSILVSDNSQLHVGGYSSIILFDFKSKRAYLFWMNGQVVDKTARIYGKKPIPIRIQKCIENNVNLSWGHVAKFIVQGDTVNIELNKK